jgi:hypothetical protein
MNMSDEHKNSTLAETENLIAWRSNEEDGYVYHLELGPSFSLHLLPDEWEELIVLIKAAAE